MDIALGFFLVDQDNMSLIEPGTHVQQGPLHLIGFCGGSQRIWIGGLKKLKILWFENGKIAS